MLLAEIVQRVSGLSLGELAAARIFQPLGLAGTGYLDTVDCPEPIPGWTAGGTRIDIAFNCVGDGGLVTCMDDLAIWDGWLPTSSLAELMLTTRPTLPGGHWAHDAWGVSIRTHRGRRIESHGGPIDGHLASFVRFPEAGVSFIALSNSDAGGPSALGARLRAFVERTLEGWLDAGSPPWSETHGIPLR